MSVPDLDARRRALTDFESNILVEAAAGTGKTRALELCKAFLGLYRASLWGGGFSSMPALVGRLGQTADMTLPIDEMWVGFRPTSRDDAPILGPTGLDGLVVATGHHRNGILLTPLTANAVSAYILTQELSDDIKPFGPGRFQLGLGSENTSRRQAGIAE